MFGMSYPLFLFSLSLCVCQICFHRGCGHVLFMFLGGGVYIMSRLLCLKSLALAVDQKTNRGKEILNV